MILLGMVRVIPAILLQETEGLVLSLLHQVQVGTLRDIKRLWLEGGHPLIRHPSTAPAEEEEAVREGKEQGRATQGGILTEHLTPNPLQRYVSSDSSAPTLLYAQPSCAAMNSPRANIALFDMQDLRSMLFD